MSTLARYLRKSSCVLKSDSRVGSSLPSEGQLCEDEPTAIGRAHLTQSVIGWPVSPLNPYRWSLHLGPNRPSQTKTTTIAAKTAARSATVNAPASQKDVVSVSSSERSRVT